MFKFFCCFGGKEENHDTNKPVQPTEISQLIASKEETPVIGTPIKYKKTKSDAHTNTSTPNSVGSSIDFSTPDFLEEDMPEVKDKNRDYLGIAQKIVFS